MEAKSKTPRERERPSEVRWLFIYHIVRHGLKLRSRTVCASANALPDDAEEDEEDEKDEEGERERKEAAEEEEEEEDGPVDADDCEVCPGTEAPPFQGVLYFFYITKHYKSKSFVLKLDNRWADDGCIKFSPGSGLSPQKPN